MPLGTMTRSLKDKWNDQIVLDELTKGIHYLPLHVQTTVRKKRKFSKSWLTKKEPTTMMRNWTRII